MLNVDLVTISKGKKKHIRYILYSIEKRKEKEICMMKTAEAERAATES
jgi:hypothetical protein